MGNNLVSIGRKIVDELLDQNSHRSGEIIAGIDGEKFHTEEVHRLVLLLTNRNASPALQIAAMGHDVERFAVPGAGKGFAEDRKGKEYEEYKKRHAKKSAEIMTEKLRQNHVPDDIVNRAGFLITHHDDTAQEVDALRDKELEVLVAADSLSWINCFAPNYFNGKEKKGIPGLINKMNFMFRKLPEKYWEFIPKINPVEPKAVPYLRSGITRIAKERGIAKPRLSL